MCWPGGVLFGAACLPYCPWRSVWISIKLLLGIADGEQPLGRAGQVGYGVEGLASAAPTSSQAGVPELSSLFHACCDPPGQLISLLRSVLAASDADLAEEDEAVDKDDVANLKKKWVPCSWKLPSFAAGLAELGGGGGAQTRAEPGKAAACSCSRPEEVRK